jgi:hypothetical protein
MFSIGEKYSLDVIAASLHMFYYPAKLSNAELKVSNTVSSQQKKSDPIKTAGFLSAESSSLLLV